jgi:hypothetical protein
MCTDIPGVERPPLEASILIRLVQVWLDIHTHQAIRGDKIITMQTALVRVFSRLEGCPIDILLSSSS